MGTSEKVRISLHKSKPLESPSGRATSRITTSGVSLLTNSRPSTALGALTIWLPGQAVSKAMDTTSVISGSSSMIASRMRAS